MHADAPRAKREPAARPVYPGGMIRLRPATLVALCLAAAPLCACGGDGDGAGATPAAGLCEFFDAPSNCFTTIADDARACVGGAFASRGALSADGRSCASKDGAVTVTFATPVNAAPPATLDLAVRRGGELCFSYRGPGSAGTPATFASGATSLTMTSDPATGELVLACDGKTWRGSLFTSKCAGGGTLPSVGTTWSQGSLSVRVGVSGDAVVDCGG